MDTGTVNKFGLTERDINTIQSILKKYSEVTEVNLFGSRALGTFKLGSDIDLSIMNEGVSQKIINKINSDFEESSLPYKIDLVNFSELKHEELIQHIIKFGVSFYKKEEAKVQ